MSETIIDGTGPLHPDVEQAITYTRATGSVSCTYNGVKVQRLFVMEDGERKPINYWLVTP